MAQIVLATEGVVERICCRPIGGKRGEVYAAGCRQIAWTKCHNGVRIWRIPGGRMHIRWEAVDIDNLTARVRYSFRTREAWVVVYKRRIEARIQRVRLCDFVVPNPKAAADHKPAAEFVSGELFWTPRKTELRAEVRLLRVELAAARADIYSREAIGSRAEIHGGQQAVLRRNRAEVLPAQACGHSQVRPHLVIVLKEKTDDVVA